MKPQKIIVYCQSKECENHKHITWNGEFIQKWVCPICQKKIQKEFKK